MLLEFEREPGSSLHPYVCALSAALGAGVRPAAVEVDHPDLNATHRQVRSADQRVGPGTDGRALDRGVGSATVRIPVLARRSASRQGHRSGLAGERGDIGDVERTDRPQLPGPTSDLPQVGPVLAVVPRLPVVGAVVDAEDPAAGVSEGDGARDRRSLGLGEWWQREVLGARTGVGVHAGFRPAVGAPLPPEPDRASASRSVTCRAWLVVNHTVVTPIPMSTTRPPTTHGQRRRVDLPDGDDVVMRVPAWRGTPARRHGTGHWSPTPLRATAVDT